MNFFKQFKNQQGLGFLEMIAALGVIVTGVIAGLTLTTYNLASSTASEGRLLAANFAREAIEVVRNKRDSNWLAEADWFDGVLTGENYRLITAFDPESNSWQLTNEAVDLETCGDCSLYYHPASGVFNHEAAEDGRPTNYKRLVTLREICWLEEISDETVLGPGDHCSDQSLDWVGWDVAADVIWIDSTGEHQLNIVYRLYDWK